MKINQITIIVGLFLMAMLALASFVAAVNDASEDSDETPMLISANTNAANVSEDLNETAKPEKNMTFGQCVAESAKLKNDCYNGAKDSYKTCHETAKNQTDKKAGKVADKECRTATKTSIKQCKVDFKAAKQECNTIKHSFMDSLKASFA